MPLLPAEFIDKSKTTPIIDVRSPAEYTHAHIVGAINIPLFDDDERAKVGTCYKQTGRDAAVRLGLKIVGPKLDNFIKQIDKIAPQRHVLVHCWRGGMRSGSMAWLLQTAGYQVYTLQGGYKAYRNYVLDFFKKSFHIIVLGGKTGSGKTEILKQLHQLGQQVIDLEALGNHKGSSYGSIGQNAQPSTEYFENLLFHELANFNIDNKIWIEDESRKVGTCIIPSDLWQQMQKAPTIYLDIPKPLRIKRLVQEYAHHSPVSLIEATQRLHKRLGGQHYQAAIKALQEANYAMVADIALNYYDKSYEYGLSQKLDKKIINVAIDEDNALETAKKLLYIIQS